MIDRAGYVIGGKGMETQPAIDFIAVRLPVRFRERHSLVSDSTSEVGTRNSLHNEMTAYGAAYEWIGSSSLRHLVHYDTVKRSAAFRTRPSGFQMTGKLLLLVEDEVLIAQSLQDALLEAGFDVELASNGKEAVEVLKANALEIGALITDIRLPFGGPDGFDIAHLARELSPSITVVYMSGDSAAQWASKGVPKSVMLAKPFAIAQLVTAVSQLLNDAGTQLG